MRKLALAVLLCASMQAHGQKILQSQNEVSPVLAKVIHDYPNDFINIKGEQLNQEPTFTNYSCLLTMKGYDPGTITHFNQEDDRVYSWQNVLFQADNFEEASKKFKQFYTMIKKTVAVIHNIEVKLDADYREPDENLPFNSIIFTMQTVEESVKNVVVELNMQYEIDSWRITVSLYKQQDLHTVSYNTDGDN